MIAASMKDAFESIDKAVMVTARKKDWKDGCTAVLALVSHGFEQKPASAEPEVVQPVVEDLWAKVERRLGKASEPIVLDEPESTPAEPQRPPGTIMHATGGVAKLFVGWCGDSRAVLLRGRTGLRCSEDHKPSIRSERERIAKAGGVVVQDNRGVWRAGPRPDNKFAKELSKKPDSQKLRWFLSTTRSFGDATLKHPDPVVIATPDVKVIDLVPEDWAVVLCCDGVTDKLTDQEISNCVWRAMVAEGKDPVGAAKALCKASLSRGSRDNVTAIVMRLGWAAPPPRGSASAPLGTDDNAEGGKEDSIFG
jgi:serine/threonine protein phosphatase PrpC